MTAAGGASGPAALGLSGPLPAAGAAADCPSCLRPGGLELTERLVALAGLRPATAALDVGCGAGATVALLTDRFGLRVTGVDASDAQVRRARAARPDLEFVCGRAEALPFAAGAFDAALCECVLSTVGERGRVLAETARVLAPNGVLLLSDLYVREGTEETPAGALPSLGRRERVEDLLGAAGFVVETWSDQTGVLARYLWEVAGSPPARAASPRSGEALGERAQLDRPRPRRLGYFAVVARLRAQGTA